MQQLRLKASIIDAADLPFACKTGRLPVNTLSSAMYVHSAMSAMSSHASLCSLCKGGAYLLAMVERLRHDHHSLRHECDGEDKGAA